VGRCKPRLVDRSKHPDLFHEIVLTKTPSAGLPTTTHVLGVAFDVRVTTERRRTNLTLVVRTVSR